MPSGYTCCKCGRSCGTYTAYVDLDAEHGVGGEFGGRRMEALYVSRCCEAAVERRPAWAGDPEEMADRRRDRRITEGY